MIFPTTKNRTTKQTNEKWSVYVIHEVLKYNVARLATVWISNNHFHSKVPNFAIHYFQTAILDLYIYCEQTNKWTNTMEGLFSKQLKTRTYEKEFSCSMFKLTSLAVDFKIITTIIIIEIEKKKKRWFFYWIEWSLCIGIWSCSILSLVKVFCLKYSFSFQFFGSLLHIAGDTLAISSHRAIHTPNTPLPIIHIFAITVISCNKCYNNDDNNNPFALNQFEHWTVNTHKRKKELSRQQIFLNFVRQSLAISPLAMHRVLLIILRWRKTEATTTPVVKAK